MARAEQDAAQGNPGGENPVAPGTSTALRLPGSAEEFAASPHGQEMRTGHGDCDSVLVESATEERVWRQE